MTHRKLAVGCASVTALCLSLVLASQRVLAGGERSDTKDWPTYNCDALGWRHNAGEKTLSKENVGRVEEKWRFPPKGADFEIGVIHATPAVVNGYVYFGTVNNATTLRMP